ncbi:biotin transporter BioY [Acuticoccus sp. I52.16.1]|uniref:biotin transporter BioY n=1 Tax=Acuticoccus sp. I52.16.1 TaxID=2928472 RepID=UPI001FD629CB|nr:biotin transporter BioY [Acuticoccus sp. I52.16.1]UOM33139.1 biotin transporter BioY [Acuticoccus sp. I52.16.1]
MRSPTPNSVLTEAFGPNTGAALRLKEVLLVVAGVAALAITAKMRVPMWPVPITMQTFAVFVIGAAYGTRLGVGTVLAYLALGALGADVFTSSSATSNGIAYMAGPTGGYLAGFAVAAGIMGAFARRGWDQSIVRMGVAVFLSTAVVYTLGLAWMSYLFAADKGMAWVLQYGMVNFLPGDVLKLALAATLVPAVHLLTARKG